MGRVPKMHTDEPPLVFQILRYLCRAHHRCVGRENRFRPAQCLELGEHPTFDLHILKHTFYDQLRLFHCLLEVGAEANMLKNVLFIFLIGCAFADHDIDIGFYFPNRIYTDIGIV